MIPWSKMPNDLRKVVLTMIIILGGTSASCRLGPMLCDPPPPPSGTPMICDPPPPPSSTPTPMICDPPPPPSTSTPTPMICDPPPPPSTSTTTPMICDPPPPPSLTSEPGVQPTITLVPGQHYVPKIVEMSSDADLEGAAVRGTVLDKRGEPVAGLAIVLERSDGAQHRQVSDGRGRFAFVVSEAGSYLLSINGDEAIGQRLKLLPHDVVIVEWTELWDESRAPLPLAEVRSVDIVWLDELRFCARSPWPGAHYRWSVSGGDLQSQDNVVTWEPPYEPGRYLLQLAADWGTTGLAVSFLVLTVDEDGNILFGS